MPTTIILACSHALGLWLFHQQKQLPDWLSNLPSVLPSSLGVLLIWVGVLCGLGCLRRQSNGVQFLWIVLLGLSSAYLSAGWMATERLSQRVSLSCHRQEINGQFLLLDRSLKSNHKETWLMRPVSTMPPCLGADAILSLSIDSDSTHAPNTIAIGDTVSASLSLRALHAPLQLEGFDVHQYWMSQGISGLGILKSEMRKNEENTSVGSLRLWFQKWRDEIRQWLFWALAEHPQLPLIMAMVIGDQGLITPEARALYADTGIAHLVAISGLHITLFALVASYGIAWVWRRSSRLCLWCPAPWAGNVGGLMFAFAYAWVAGWGPPAQRTVLMLAAMLIVRWRNTNSSPWEVWGLGLLLTLAMNPWGILDAGLLLSFGAVGILIFSTQGYYVFRSVWPEWLRQPVRAQWTVTVGLLVPCAMMFNQQSLVGFAVNALSIPWMSFVSTPLALMGGLFKQHWALSLAAYSLDVQSIWLTYFGQLSWATWFIPNQAWWILVLAGLGCLILIIPRGVLPRWLGFLLIACLVWPAPRPKDGEFWVTVMDVGQGTALAIQTRQHLLIYDTGPARDALSDSGLRVILPWLKAKGYSSIDHLWVSHSDSDHAGGASMVLNKVKVGQFVNSMSPTQTLNELAQQKGVPTAGCHQYTTWRWDDVVFEPISIPEIESAKANTDNNRSCVLRIHNAQGSILLTGDIGLFSEALLLASHPAETFKSTVLLAPHHGSKTSSSPAFLEAVSPETVVIQAGWKNTYGHPHPDVLARYQSMGLEVLETPQLGAMRFVFKNTSSSIIWESAIEQRERYWHLHKTGARVR